jgi:hypothetical protein
VDLAILETAEEIAKPYTVVRSSEVLTTGQQVWFMGAFPAVKLPQPSANSPNHSRPVPEPVPAIKIGTIATIDPTRPDSFEIRFPGKGWNLLIASGPIVYWSPAHRDYEILGVIKRNDRDAVDAPFNSDPPQKVVKEGILQGYSIDVVVDAINGNPHS